MIKYSWEVIVMDKNQTGQPIISTYLGRNESSVNLAKKLSNFLDDKQLNVDKLQELMSSYRCALLEVETKFRVLNEQFSLENEHNPIDSIKTRIKSPKSIQEKLLRKNLPFTVDSINNSLNDIAGIRVICPFVDDIYVLADCLLQQDDITLMEKVDYIKKPKASGYRSLHLIVKVPIFLQNEKRMMKVEVQLRTIAMEFWANLEHKLRYKKNIPNELLKLIENELQECAETSAHLDLKMQNIRNTIENN